MNVNIYINCVNILPVVSTKFLGVVIDSQLTWKFHIEQMERKIASSVGVLRRIRDKINAKTACMIYNTMILPYLNYCNIIWASTYKTKMHKIHVLQKKAMRIIARAESRASSIPIFYSLKKLTIYDINKMHIANFMYLLQNNLLPSVVQNTFAVDKPSHDYNTRSRERLCIPFTRLTCYAFHPHIMGPRIWNDIPYQIQKSLSYASFKMLYRKMLLSKYMN